MRVYAQCATCMLILLLHTTLRHPHTIKEAKRPGWNLEILSKPEIDLLKS